MKKRLFILLILLTVCISGCTKEEKVNEKESENQKMELKQDLTIIKEENNEIVEGTLEGYTFKVTEEKTVL